MGVAQKGEHGIIYGERGVGKTSLANVLTEFLKGLGLKSLTSVRVNCDVRTTFSELWTRIFRELQLSEVQPNPNNDEDQLALAIPDKHISPDDVRYMLQGTT
jgi:Cdc6-like AAA superfamily ATPase